MNIYLRSKRVPSLGNMEIKTFEEFEQGMINKTAHVFMRDERSGRNWGAKNVPIMMLTDRNERRTIRYNIYMVRDGVNKGKILEIPSRLDKMYEKQDVNPVLRARTLCFINEHCGMMIPPALTVPRENLKLIHEELELGRASLWHSSTFEDVLKKESRSKKLKLAYDLIRSSTFTLEYRVKVGFALSSSKFQGEASHDVKYVLSDGSLISRKEIQDLIYNESIDAAFKAVSK